MPISRIEKSVARSAVKSVYGSGADGNVVIATTITLTSDMFYNTLNVTSAGILLTNGYRVFVKDTLTLDGHIGIGSVSSGTIGEPSSAVSDGTVKGSTTHNSITYRTGGQGGGPTNPNITALPTYLYKQINMMASAVMIDASGSIIPISGGSKGTEGVAGAPGATGAAGAAGSPGAAGATVPAGAGSAGAAGTNGGYGPSATTVNAAGGRGNTGATGASNASPAAGGSAGSGGAGGAGGAGGGG